ncbi:MAG: flavodoxin domain-containing protein [Candidatus Didemnitutus sp.]|nr:flavodoxin domain-containing protein [Candidatus Didemnitutus sp.]
MSRVITVLYASASGNAEELAATTAAHWRARGAQVELHNLADFPCDRLTQTDIALVLASTWGEGAPPPDAEKFCAELRAASTPLPHLHYAVLALGASMYREFCGCGRRIDADLARLGAHALVPRVDCDTKYKTDFTRWLTAVETALALPA